MFSSTSSSVTVKRESFDEIAEPVPCNKWVSNNPEKTQSKEEEPEKQHEASRKDQKVKAESDLDLKKDEKIINGSVALAVNEHGSTKKGKKESTNAKRKKSSAQNSSNEVAKGNNLQEESETEELDKEEEEGEVVDGREVVTDGQIEENGEVVEGEGELKQWIRKPQRRWKMEMRGLKLQGRRGR